MQNTQTLNATICHMPLATMPSHCANFASHQRTRSKDLPKSTCKDRFILRAGRSRSLPTSAGTLCAGRCDRCSKPCSAHLTVIVGLGCKRGTASVLSPLEAARRDVIPRHDLASRCPTKGHPVLGHSERRVDLEDHTPTGTVMCEWLHVRTHVCQG